MRNLFVIGLLMLSGCGYQFSPKEITLEDSNGKQATVYSCGSYMRVSSEGWFKSTFEVTFTDNEGLTHDLYGMKEVGVSDIPRFVNAPMYGFQYDHYLGERYMDKPDGTPGDLIKEGDIVVKGDNQARLVNGKWKPVKVVNMACIKSSN